MRCPANQTHALSSATAICYNSNVRIALRLLLLVLLLCVVQAMAVEPKGLADGIALVGAGDYAGALGALRPVVEERPDDGVAQYWLGRAYYGQRLYRLAAQALAVAEERDPRNREVCQWYARALRVSGQFPAAVAAYRSFLARFPDDPVLLPEYAVARAQAGDMAGARETFTQLLAHDPAAKALVNAWLKSLDGVTTMAQLEPDTRRKTGRFEIRYGAGDPAAGDIITAIEQARAEVSQTFGQQITGFRVLLFPTWDAYLRYARVLLPDTRELHATAITFPGLLVLWSPSDWPQREGNEAEFRSTLRHELVHLAIAQRTGGEGVPLWLNEGLACHIGGYGGMQGGHAPAEPFTIQELDKAFLTGDLNTIEKAYAQAQAMGTVLMAQLGTQHVLRLLDRLARGELLPDAYQAVAGETFTAYLAEWPGRYRALLAQR